MTDRGGMLIDADIARLQSQLSDVKAQSDAQGRRIAILEEKLFPPAPVPPTVKQRLQVRDGQFFEGDKPFRDHGFTIAGTAFGLKDRDMRRRMLDTVRGLGCRLVRFLHTAINDPTDGISEYQPTYYEYVGGFDQTQEWLDDLKDRGMYGWFTCHHRQRVILTASMSDDVKTTLFDQPRPAGIVKGEISELFLLFPELESLVHSFAVEFAKRFKDHPALGLITCANEKLGTRVRGYYPQTDRKRTDLTPYGKAWLKKLDEFQAVTGYTDDMTKPMHVEFGAWLGFTSYRRFIAKLREAGVKCPIGASNIFGDSTMGSLVELSAGDFIDVHRYPTSTPTLPDPFLQNATCTIVDVARAARLFGKPLVLGEYAGVNEHGPSKGKAASFLNAPRFAAEAGFDITSHYCAWLGKIGNAGMYDALDDAMFVESFRDSRSIFAEYEPSRLDVWMLETKDVFGYRERISEGNWSDRVPPIIGVGKYGADGVELPESVKAWVQ